MNNNKLTDSASREIGKSRIKNSNVRNNKSNHKGNNEKVNKRTTTNLKDKYKFKDNNFKIQTQDKEKTHRRSTTYDTNRYHIIAQTDQITSNNMPVDNVTVEKSKTLVRNKSMIEILPTDDLA